MSQRKTHQPQVATIEEHRVFAKSRDRHCDHRTPYIGILAAVCHRSSNTGLQAEEEVEEEAGNTRTLSVR